MSNKQQRWIYAALLFIIELSMIIMGFILLVFTYQTFFTDATSSIFLEFEGNLNTYLNERV